MNDGWLAGESGAKAFGTIYLECLDDISARLEARIAPHPVFGPLLASMPEELKAESARASRERAERAFAGDWAPFELALRRDGATYAALGIELHDWFDLTTMWGKDLIPILVERLHGDATALAGALSAMHAFIGRAMATLAKAYMDASADALRRNEAELAAIIECIGDGVVATDHVGRVVRINPAALGLVGMSAADIRGQGLEDVVRIERAADGNVGEGMLVRKDGSELPVLSTRSRITAADDLPRGEVLVVRDVSSIRAREEALAQWAAMFHSVGWGIAITESEGSRVNVANPAFARMYGLEADAVRGRDIATLFAPDALQDVAAAHQQAARETGHASYETVHVREDGTRFPVRVEAARIPGLAGANAWVLTVHDLSDQQQIQSLRAHSLELELENRRVNEASRLKSEFLANMSHELRTPLNSILGFSGLLADGEVGALSERQLEFIGDIHTSGKHLLRMINDVLDLSKVEAGRMEFHPEPTDLRLLIGEVTSVLRGIAVEKQIHPEVVIDDEASEVRLDPARLKQVLYNFLSNAFKFSPPRGRVGIRVTADGASIRIEVSDEGPGILEVDQARLFREFEQLDASAAKAHSGTGLGLALTRGLVEAQGGNVGVRSKRGEGSVFYAVLPRKLAARTSLPQPRRIAGHTKEAPRILVIEDDASDQERIVSSLVAAGFAVDTATTGAQALRACRERRYDAITLDLLLPDTTGLDLLRELRQLAPASTPIIVISIVSDRVSGGYVVHDVLPKPLEPSALLESLLRAGVELPDASAVLVVDDDEASAKLMVATLEQVGLRAVVARDGEQGLEVMRQERPVAVVLDLVMPNLDGFGFLERFSAEPEWDSIPVLIWSVKDLSDDDCASLLQRAEIVLPKDGTTARSLVDVLQKHLSRRALAEADG